MTKTKKALLAALACSAALAGAIGLAACNGDGGSGGGHSHDWGDWTVAQNPSKDGTGLATRTCGKSGCDAKSEDKEHVLPVLSEETYGTPVTKTAADCATDGVLTYTYNNTEKGVNVSFDVNVGKDANVHDYVYANEGPTGHTGVCSHNEEHTLAKTAHDTDGVNGGCAACGVEKLIVTQAENQPESGTRYTFEVAESGYYEIWGAENVLLPNITAFIACDITVGTLGEDGALEAITDVTLELYLTTGTYYIDDVANNTISVVFVKAHEHTYNTDEWVNDTIGHWHAATCGHENLKSDYAEHSFGEWSEPNEEGVKERACTCGYKEYQGDGNNSTRLEGSYDEEDPELIDCTETGNYIVTVGSEEDMFAEVGWGETAYAPVTLYFTLQNEGSTARKYTFKTLNAITYISVEDGDPYDIYEEGATIEMVVEAGQTLNFAVSTNEMDVDENYAADAMFKITVEDAA